MPPVKILTPPVKSLTPNKWRTLKDLAADMHLPPTFRAQLGVNKLTGQMSLLLPVFCVMWVSECELSPRTRAQSTVNSLTAGGGQCGRLVVSVALPRALTQGRPRADRLRSLTTEHGQGSPFCDLPKVDPLGDMRGTLMNGYMSYDAITKSLGVWPGRLAHLLTDTNWAPGSITRRRRTLLSNEAAKLGRSLALGIGLVKVGNNQAVDTAVYGRARYAARLAALRLDW